MRQFSCCIVDAEGSKESAYILRLKLILFVRLFVCFLKDRLYYSSSDSVWLSHKLQKLLIFRSTSGFMALTMKTNRNEIMSLRKIRKSVCEIRISLWSRRCLEPPRGGWQKDSFLHLWTGLIFEFFTKIKIQLHIKLDWHNSKRINTSATQVTLQSYNLFEIFTHYVHFN